MKKRIVLLMVGFLITFLLRLNPAQANQQVLTSIKGCLPRPPQENVRYRFSLATQVDDLEAAPSKPFKYLLIRVEDSSLPYMWYNVVGLKVNKHCINYSTTPLVDSDLLKLFPDRISSKFQPVITSDRNKIWDDYTKSVQRQYPGKTIKELQRMGLLGLD